MEEIWKDVEGYEGLYQVSSMGRVKSLARTRNMNLPGHKKPAPVPERILKFGESQGYQAVTLAKDGKNRKIRVHKLVALAFIPNPAGKPEINHKDGNKHNNTVENLEWVTPKENIRHARETGLIISRPGNKNFRHTVETKRLMSEKQKVSQKYRKKRILQYTKDGSFVREWLGFESIRAELKCSGQMVYRCCIGKEKQAHGYVWKYADE